MRTWFLISLFSLQMGWSRLAMASESRCLSFQEVYANWVAYLADLPVEVRVQSSVSGSVLYDNEPFRRIVELGNSAVPEIMQMLDNDRRLIRALEEITQWKYEVVRTDVAPAKTTWTVVGIPSISETNGPPDRVAVWKIWWEEHREKFDTPK